MVSQHLDIIQSTTDDAASPLLYFWSSLMVNFMAPGSAIPTPLKIEDLLLKPHILVGSLLLRQSMSAVDLTLQ